MTRAADGTTGVDCEANESAKEGMKKRPKIENAIGRSLWRLNLDGLVVQPVLRPSATPVVRLQLSLPLLPLAAPAFNLRLASAANFPARPRANPPARIGVVSPGSVGGKYPAFTVYYALPIDWLLTLQLALASGLQLGLRLLPTHIWRRPSARLAFQLPILTGCLCNSPLALPAAATPSSRWRLPPLPHRFQTADSRRPLFPGFAGFGSLGLRRARLPPVGPLMHPLLQSNLASPAEPSMSIQLSAGSRTLRICQLNNLRLASAFAISGATSDPSSAFASGFTLWLGWR